MKLLFCYLCTTLVDKKTNVMGRITVTIYLLRIYEKPLKDIIRGNDHLSDSESVILAHSQISS